MEAVLLSCALLCGELAHVSPSPVDLDTGPQQGDGRKLTASFPEGGEGSARAGECGGAGGGQVLAPKQARAGKKNKVSKESCPGNWEETC